MKEVTRRDFIKKGSWAMIVGSFAFSGVMPFFKSTPMLSEAATYGMKIDSDEALLKFIETSINQRQDTAGRVTELKFTRNETSFGYTLQGLVVKPNKGDKCFAIWVHGPISDIYDFESRQDLTDYIIKNLELSWKTDESPMRGTFSN